ncbi:MAG: acetylxylan esterase [Pirellulales bacterium]|nr:acetylxylan esterase [Pirellulales bacterium]
MSHKMSHENLLDRRTALTLLAGSMATATVAPWEAAGAEVAAANLPDDRRLGPLKNLTGYFPFDPPESLEEWKARAEKLRRRVLLAAGLWPPPEPKPVLATVWGPVQGEGYTVSRVYFQSSPGLWVTGSLYKPDGIEGKIPAILCPHGHWREGRFHAHSEEQFAKELEWGSEEDRPSGRYPLQSRCVTLCRMGCLVFHYDMLGYADSAPVEMIAHGTRRRAEMEQKDHWGLFSPQAELRLISSLGLQTFNSLRTMDWICSLPEVDTTRIGVTGASGGGTQTFMLTAIDDRVAAAFPAVMASTSMQGGCPCENACYLRIGAGNIDFTALAAPRPLGLSAANDWTVELESKGLPELKQLYHLYGAEEKVEGKHFDFEHNYNALSRAMMYAFFDKHFHLGHKENIESEYKPLTRSELTVWGPGHPKPACGAEAEVEAITTFNQARQQQIDALVPHDTKSLARYRQIVGGALQVMIGRSAPKHDSIEQLLLSSNQADRFNRESLLVSCSERGEEIPAVRWVPPHTKRFDPPTTLWITDTGKAAVEPAPGQPIRPVSDLLQRGGPVVAADLLYQGEFLPEGGTLNEARLVPHVRYSLGYSFGYNDPLFVQRVNDVLSLCAAFDRGAGVNLVGLGRIAGPVVAAAGAIVALGEQQLKVNRLAVFTSGFRFNQITKFNDPMMLPGAVRYGDVPFLLALNAPQQMWIGGEGNQLSEVVEKCYASARAKRPEVFIGSEKMAAAAVSRWMSR